MFSLGNISSLAEAAEKAAAAAEAAAMDLSAKAANTLTELGAADEYGGGEDPYDEFAFSSDEDELASRPGVTDEWGRMLYAMRLMRRDFGKGRAVSSHRGGGSDGASGGGESETGAADAAVWRARCGVLEQRLADLEGAGGDNEDEDEDEEASRARATVSSAVAYAVEASIGVRDLRRAYVAEAQQSSEQQKELRELKRQLADAQSELAGLRAGNHKGATARGEGSGGHTDGHGDGTGGGHGNGDENGDNDGAEGDFAQARAELDRALGRAQELQRECAETDEKMSRELLRVVATVGSGMAR